MADESVFEQDDNPISVQSTNVDIMRRILNRYEGCAAGFQHLESGYDYWFFRQGGIVVGGCAYIKTKTRIIIPGLPIGPPHQRKAMLNALREEFRRFKLIFVAAEHSALDSLNVSELEIDRLLIGFQSEWHNKFDLNRPDRRNIRRQIKRARNKSVNIEKLDLGKEQNRVHKLNDEIQQLLETWTNQRRLDRFGFMINPELNLNRGFGHIFMARRHGRLVGLLSAIPTPGGKGWLLEDILRRSDAPNGTVEWLIATAFESLQTDKTPFITLGMVPFVELSEDDGSHQLTNKLKHLAQLAGFFMNFESLKKFKTRFRPDRWQPAYIAAVNDKLSLGDLLAIGIVIANNRPFRFLARSTLLQLKASQARTWQRILCILLIALIPWTILLASIDGQQWLGSQSIQLAWVTFDVLLAFGFVGLIQRLNQHALDQYAWIVGGATLTDLILSIVQASIRLPETQGLANLLLFASVLGPLIATVALFLLGWVNPSPRPIQN